MARILAQLGVKAVDDSGAEVAVTVRAAPEPWFLWPCNARIWSVWCRLQTQWQTGMAGATGLHYPSVLAVIDRALPRRHRGEAFATVQRMELETLTVWAEKRKT